MTDILEVKEVPTTNEDGSSAVTDWENEPTIANLHQNIKDAQSDYDRHVMDVDSWFEDIFIDKVPAVRKNQSSVAPKLIRKQAEWRYPSLSEPFLSTPDIFNIDPKGASDLERARQNELVLNNQFNTKMNKVAFIDSYVRDIVDIGTVIVKVGWDSEEEEVTKTRPVYEYNLVENPELQMQYMQYVQMQMQDPDLYANYSTPGLDQALEYFKERQLTYVPEEVGAEEYTEVIETKNQPTVEVYNYKNMIVDPSCNGDTAKANFIGERFKTSLSELRKDGKYINLDSINIEGASPLANEDYEEGKDNESFNFTDNTRKQFVVHTYWGNWDIDNSGIAKPIVASWVGDVMIRLEENPYPDKRPPFVIAVYMPVRDSVYGEPDCALLKPNQNIVGAVTRGMIDLLAKSANSQQGIRKDMLDTTNIRKFRRGDDYEFNATVDPRQGFYQHVYPEIPQSAYNMLTLQTDDAEGLTGIKAFQSGINGKSLGSTATGVRSVMDATSKREISILRRLAQGMIEIGHKVLAMNAVFLSEEETVRVTNKQFIQVRRDDLAGKFDIRLAISTAEEDNRKAEELAFMLQTTGPNSDPGEVRMIRAEIARLRKMPVLAKKIEEYQPQPDPIAQAKAQLEVKLLEAQIAKEEALAEKNHAAARLDMARIGKEASQADLNESKTGTERAKMHNLSSVTDKQDLDFLEQESGVHQERELEQLHVKHRQAIEQKQHTAETDLAAKMAESNL